MFKFKVVAAFLALLFFAAACISCDDNDDDSKNDSSNSSGKAKYVFFFIGDGMAMPQINAAETYLAQTNGSSDIDLSSSKLALTSLPAQGLTTTYSNNSYITDSAAAGTALASGNKTDSGMINMNPALDTEYTTIAEAAKAAGMKVGVVSSVSIDHATPASFYAHNESRNNYSEIGQDLLESDFDYFAGGTFRYSKWKGKDDYEGKSFSTMSSSSDVQAALEEIATDKGYTWTDTRAEFDAISESAEKVIAFSEYVDGSNAMPYYVDRKNNATDYKDHITLAEFTAKGIEVLDNDENGFFLMVEGGKIDWACHANDGGSVIQDTIAFDNAVKEALEFYEEHPDETLIVVTGDHETGGLTIGFAGTGAPQGDKVGYVTYYDIIKNQTISYDDFNAVIDEQCDGSTSSVTVPALSELQDEIKSAFGLKYSGDSSTDGLVLTDWEQTEISDAYNEAVTLFTENATKYENGEEDYPATWGYASYYGKDQDLTVQGEYELYGGYNPFTIKLTHILNRKAGIGWTSYSHTGVPVQTFAKGVNETEFNGYYDNTDVYTKIKAAMGL